MLQSADGAQAYCFQRWGRTGTTGQTNLDGPFASAEVARRLFADKFSAKTGGKWSDTATTDGDAGAAGQLGQQPGKYSLLAKNYLRPEEAAAWQYWVDDGVDGKRTGWYDYAADASRIVEGVYLELQDNPAVGAGMDVRCVKSGNWTYRVDFNLMTQTNAEHASHTCRRIQRRVE